MIHLDLWFLTFQKTTVILPRYVRFTQNLVFLFQDKARIFIIYDPIGQIIEESANLIP